MGAPDINIINQPDNWSWLKWLMGILATVIGGFILWVIKRKA